jgi:hypothetical protein
VVGWGRLSSSRSWSRVGGCEEEMI